MELLLNELPEEVRRAFCGRRALHHWSKTLNPRLRHSLRATNRADHERIAQCLAPTAHPLVRTHPDSGRSSLFVSPRFTTAIDGVPATESEDTLKLVFELMKEPRLCYRHVWRRGDVLIWDNRCLSHRARTDYAWPQRRTMFRITLTGQRPYYRNNPNASTEASEVPSFVQT
jgi:taurine dioxygenase